MYSSMTTPCWTLPRFLVFCIDMHMELALYEYANILIVIKSIIIFSSIVIIIIININQESTIG